MAARNRERVGPVRGPRLDTGVSLQGMTSFSFHAEALGYILCLFRGCPPPPPPPSQPRQGPQTDLTLSLYL